MRATPTSLSIQRRQKRQRRRIWSRHPSLNTFVYRAGDQIGAWSYPLFTWFGLGLIGI